MHGLGLSGVLAHCRCLTIGFSSHINAGGFGFGVSSATSVLDCGTFADLWSQLATALGPLDFGALESRSLLWCFWSRLWPLQASVYSGVRKTWVKALFFHFVSCSLNLSDPLSSSVKWNHYVLLNIVVQIKLDNAVQSRIWTVKGEPMPNDVINDLKEEHHPWGW